MPTPTRTGMLVALTLLGVGCASQTPTERDGSRRAGASPTAFLAGRWIHEDDGAVMEETWFPPHAADGASAGMLRWTGNDGAVRMYELMSLTPLDDGAVSFQLRHFGGDMSPWSSEADGPLRGVIDAPEPNRLVIRCTERHGDVETITYERTEPDAMRATLRFAEGSGREPIVIDYLRAE